jgi:hypothetical protein
MLHKSLSSFCLQVHSLLVPRKPLSRNVTAATNTQTTIEDVLDHHLLCSPCRIEGKQAVISRTSYVSGTRCYDIVNGLSVRGAPDNIFTSRMTIDGVWIDNRIYHTRQLGIMVTIRCTRH